MLEAEYLDSEVLVALLGGAGKGSVVAALLAMAAELSTLRSAFVSLLGVVETQMPAAREIVLQDLHEVLSKEMHPPEGIESDQGRVEALTYLIDALEMDLRPDQT
jgi:hypothetical protein